MPVAISKSTLPALRKAPTGIEGLDQITFGGLPRGRSTLVAGGPGSGKTLLAMEFVLRGILEYNEPGVVMTFEESAEELAANLSSLGYDMAALIHAKKLVVDHVHVERREIEETGEYDLEALFIRLEHAIRSVKAKRVVLDTVEVLFAGLSNAAVVRSELARLFRWMKDRNLTAVITSETGQSSLTRHGLEEYVADCVLLLDHRVSEQISTRRVRVLKYRGSRHGTNEYPFLLDADGINVLPITSVGLNHQASTERLSSGIAGLDAMLGGNGFYRASSILISGTAGTGKSSMAAQFVNAACARGERALYFAFEESPAQILRNMRSVGLNLETWIKKGLLTIHAVRPTVSGLEAHLAAIHAIIGKIQPQVVVVDPITNLVSVGETYAVKSMLTRMVDYLKNSGITAVFTNLSVQNELEQTTTEISSLMDTWILLREMEVGFERERVIYLLKSRGMAHASDVRQLIISERGMEILPRNTAEAKAKFREGNGNGDQANHKIRKAAR